MDFLQPRSLAEAVETAQRYPDAVPIAGGTDVMVDMNFARRRPPALLDLTRVPELTRWESAGGLLRVGAGVSYATLITELGGVLPGLAMASRTVGSPQIRNRGTLGGNLGSASPAGDALPVLLASGAVVETASVQGSRQIPAGELLHRGEAERAAARRADRGRAAAAGPGTAAVLQGGHAQRDGHRGGVVRGRGGPGTAADRHRHRVGGAYPAPRRPPPRTSWPGCWPNAGCGNAGRTWTRPTCTGSGELAAAAAAPIDDVRGTAAYRTHALAVMARRALRWAWRDYLSGG